MTERVSERVSERAFESAVESMLLGGGWLAGDRSEWDVERALFPDRVVGFLSVAQPELWERMAAQLGVGQLKEMIVERLVRELDLKGTLNVLRHGFRFHGQPFRLAYFQPAHGLNPETIALFGLNGLTVTRQVSCHPGEGDTVDMLFALNGVPVATCELKNPMTGQTWQDAVRQYKDSRNPDAPLFRFRRRALVHFAADPDEVHMTTRLDGDRTRFLPFNRGSQPGGVRCGAGNPQHPSGYRTGYFWQDVLERERFLDIIGSYMFVERRSEKVYDEPDADTTDDTHGTPGTSQHSNASDAPGTTDAPGAVRSSRVARTVERRTLIFPRYHQLDAVTRLVKAARVDGPGRNYLVQHSAGSGKTNSISWLSHRLASLHTADDEKVYDCVLVITDRRVLDRQLQDAVYQIQHAQGVVQAIDRDSQQLAEALLDGTKIVVTTLQKFPFVMQGLLSAAGGAPADNEPSDAATSAHRQRAARWRRRIAGRRYAVIVDEAHSGQSGESAREMKNVLGARSQQTATAVGRLADWEDGLNAVMQSRGRQPNLSFFAFTATPKAKTMELFGRKGGSGKPEPFHVYSMRQAIEEGFILDVLGNYVDYDTYYQIVKKAEDDPDLPKRRTSATLAKFLALHPHNVAQKTEVIVEHFRNHVRHRIGGKAKAMVVASSRLQVVRYMNAFRRYIARQGYKDVHPLVAFSGTVRDPETGEEFTEPSMNIDVVSGERIAESALADRFDSPDYQILLVAEKYQTGFDQPLLQAMYIDKRLDGVQAVQTLSRLNRTAPGKTAPFVLDFVNDPEDTHKAFTPYYDQTLLQDRSDPYQLDQLKHELDETQIYHHAEVEDFAAAFYRPPAARNSTHDHACLEAALQPACDRFDRRDEEQQAEFRDRLSAYLNLYSFLSQIIPYADSELERLYAYGRALLPRLRPDRDTIRLSDDIELEYYRLQKISSGAIDLADSDHDAEVKGPTDVGTGNPEEDEAPLSEIIERLNERFGTDFTESERLFLQQVQHDATSRDDIRCTAEANPFDKFSLGIRPQLQKLLIERMAGNDELVTRCLDDPDFQEVVYTGLLKSIFDTITA